MGAKKIVVLTGAGISAESGLKTFRDSNGLWEGHDVMEVASPEGWQRNRELVLRFYNERRRQLLTVEPNVAHKALALLDKYFETVIVTQNVDDLHERGGSARVLHLHGELLKVRSEGYPHLVYDWKKDLHTGDLCEKGAQLRPHIVWFGEAVPAMEQAIDLAQAADIFIIIGTSLVVYPAAGLVNYTGAKELFYIDPKADEAYLHCTGLIKATAVEGVPPLVQKLIEHYG